MSPTPRLPLFSIPGMGYPEGGSVLFADALPLGALCSKILYALSGLRVNPLGWWILAHVLQGAMAARLIRATGVRSVVAGAAAATFAVCSNAFLHRTGHVALSSHFLILWALALYFEMVRARRARTGELTLALAVTLLVNAYLFAMVAAIGGAALFTLWLKRALPLRAVVAAGAGALVVLVIGLMAGYGVMFTNPTSMQAFGFGVFSWNPASLVVPRAGPDGNLAGVSRDATGGQYQGDAYVGLGVLLALAVAVLWSPRRTYGQLRRHWPLCLLLLAFAVYAASNRMYLGGRLLVAYDLPPVLLEFFSYFRASGRFIWPVAYAIAILPLAGIFKWWRPAPAALLALIATWLQITEAMPAIEQRRRSLSQPYADMLVDSPVPSWVSAHRRLWMYPAWPCGGLGPPGRPWGRSGSEPRAPDRARRRARERSHQQRLHVTPVEELPGRSRLGQASRVAAGRALPDEP